ncbi:hypothetical protein AB0G79_33040 [Streptomyces sp. NPDC020807]|uniref:hypothetical protein n=1 Tax=Streptomyces sp. NPDC020807 TaxID=3155119 RepID=UPI0033EA8649
MTPTYETHQRRAVEEDGTVHAARYAGDRHSFTTACAVYPAPAAARLDSRPLLRITCAGCLAALRASDGDDHHDECAEGLALGDVCCCAVIEAEEEAYRQEPADMFAREWGTH